MESYDKTVLLLPMRGANNGTEFPDYSPVPKIATRAGDAKTVTGQSKYYGSSGYFDGSGDYLSFPHLPEYQLGAVDFLFEAYVFCASAGQITIASKRTSSTSGSEWSLYVSNYAPTFVAWNTVGGAYIFASAAGALSANTWQHLAVSKSGSTTRIFVDGIVVATATTVSGTYLTNQSPLLICREANYTTRDWMGNLQDIRIVAGAPVHTEAFSPPPRLLGQISGTVTDETGSPAVRKVCAVPRAAPARTFTTDSAADGTYSIWVPSTECSRIVLAQDAGTPGPTDPVLPDLVDRVIPA